MNVDFEIWYLQNLEAGAEITGLQVLVEVHWLAEQSVKGLSKNFPAIPEGFLRCILELRDRNLINALIDHRVSEPRGDTDASIRNYSEPRAWNTSSKLEIFVAAK